MGKRKDLTGMSFERLTVIKYVRTNKHRKAIWECECVCGNVVFISSNDLLRGHTKSCGCYKSDITRKRVFVNLKGKRFYKLLVIKFCENKKEKNYWECSCDCGNRIIVNTNSLTSGNTRSCGCTRNESQIAIELKKYYKKHLNAIPEYKDVINPLTGKFLPYDIFIPSYNAYIEVQGEQHYSYKKYFGQTKEGFKNRLYLDKIKKEHAVKNGLFIEIDLREIKTLDDAIQHIEKLWDIAT